MNKVSVLGWYGHANIGDEAILAGLKNLFSGWNMTVFSDTFKSVYPTLDYKFVNNSDLFVLGGGELIHCNRLFYYSPFVKHTFIPGMVHRAFTFLPWIQNIKVPKVILGCGVDVNDKSEVEPIVVKGLEQFDYIGLRDIASVNILRSFPSLVDKVHLFYDLAYALETDRYRKAEEDYVVVAPTDRKYLDTVVCSKLWLKEVLPSYSKAVFVPFGQQDNNDFVTCQQLMSCHSNSEVINPEDATLKKTLDLISRCKTVVAYRLHGLIFASMFQKQYMYYPYKSKLERVHSTIKNLVAEDIKRRQKEMFDKLIKDVRLD